MFKKDRTFDKKPLKTMNIKTQEENELSLKK